METVVIDLETYWDTGHTLSKMNPIEYCTHPETEIISMAAKFGKGETQVIFGEANIKNICARIDWSDKWVIGHNLSGFDSMILAWRLGIKPRMWGCTMAMAAPHHTKDPGLSLAKLVEHYGVGVKDNSALLNTKGKHLADFTPDEVKAMGGYNKADVGQCHALFKRLIKKTSRDELRLIDMTIRMLVEPKFEVDTALLRDTLDKERTRKQLMLRELATMLGEHHAGMGQEEAANAVAKTLASAPKFAKLLKDLGVEVPTKTSPATGKPAPALAKTDEGFVALQNHPNPLVATAATARLGVKSTLLETRIGAFLAATTAANGKLPIPLRYCGADTTWRWSGWAYNPQNLPRIGKNPKPTDALRNSLRAPKGHMVVVADLSGIELRVNHFLWKVPSSMALFQADPEKADLYKDFASRLYDKPIEEVTKDERQVGKVAHLGLGFGAGPATFQKVAKSMAGIDLSETDAADVVYKWREEYQPIVQGWKDCHDALPVILAGQEGYPIDPWGMCVPTKDGILTPKGFIRYPKLRLEKDENGKKEYWYGEGRHKARIYAGKVTENIVQHLARCIIADNALDIKKATGESPALMVHDELVYVIREEFAEDHLNAVQRIMRTPPVWWPQLITWSEGAVAETYGQAK